MNIEELHDSYEMRQWFALRVKSRYEKLVATMAHNKGFEEFLPLYQCRRRWSDRFKSVELPLFPGYVFCRLNPEFRLPILTIPGVLHFVGLGKDPVPIDDAEIAAIQTAVRSGLEIQPWPFLDVGQRVRVEAALWRASKGFWSKCASRHRIMVSVSLLKRSVGVEIEADWVRPLNADRRGPSIRIKRPVSVTAACA